MRIAFLVPVFPTLSETFVLNQITGLIDAGHEVDVYAWAADEASKVHADVQRYRLLERTHYRALPASYLRRAIKAMGHLIANRRRPRAGVVLRALNVRAHGMQALSLSLLYTSVLFLSQKPYDIVHCQFATLARAGIALRETGATASGKLVVSFRGADLTAHGPISRYREVFDKCDLFLPVCDSFRARLIDAGCAPEKIRVHHSGIRLSRFTHTERRRTPGEPTRVLAVARLVEKKGVAYALQAIARVKRSGRAVRFLVVGDGPLRVHLERTIGELDLGADVDMAGSRTQDEVLTLLRDSHLLIAPSVTAESGEQEGIPNVLKEAMATGIPVIGTRHSGIPELIGDGVSGLLVPERDVEALADGLAHLIDHPERWAAMGRAGRERIETEFDSDKLNARLIGLYQQVASGTLPVGRPSAMQASRPHGG